MGRSRKVALKSSIRAIRADPPSPTLGGMQGGNLHEPIILETSFFIIFYLSDNSCS